MNEQDTLAACEQDVKAALDKHGCVLTVREVYDDGVLTCRIIAVAMVKRIEPATKMP